MDMDHPQRSAWLAGIVSPRPLILASTVDKNGIKNLAPLSSVMGVSNTPPLFIASFSRNRRKEYRGTLLNMRQTGKAILHVMPSTLQAVDWIDMAGSPILPDQSEWDLIDITPHDEDELLIKQAIAAIEVELVEEKELPGAVARLAVMKVTHIWASSDKIPETGLDVLTQHGMDNMNAIVCPRAAHASPCQSGDLPGPARDLPSPARHGRLRNGTPPAVHHIDPVDRSGRGKP